MPVYNNTPDTTPKMDTFLTCVEKSNYNRCENGPSFSLLYKQLMTEGLIPYLETILIEIDGSSGSGSPPLLNGVPTKCFGELKKLLHELLVNLRETINATESVESLINNDLVKLETVAEVLPDVESKGRELRNSYLEESISSANRFLDSSQQYVSRDKCDIMRRILCHFASLESFLFNNNNISGWRTSRVPQMDSNDFYSRFHLVGESPHALVYSKNIQVAVQLFGPGLFFPVHHHYGTELFVVLECDEDAGLEFTHWRGDKYEQRRGRKSDDGLCLCCYGNKPQWDEHPHFQITPDERKKGTAVRTDELCTQGQKAERNTIVKMPGTLLFNDSWVGHTTKNDSQKSVAATLFFSAGKIEHYWGS